MISLGLLFYRKKSDVTKKLQKFDVTVDITLKPCYSTTIRCNNEGYNKNNSGGTILCRK